VFGIKLPVWYGKLQYFEKKASKRFNPPVRRLKLENFLIDKQFEFAVKLGPDYHCGN